MKNILLASTSTVFGSDYLTYLQTEIEELYAGINQIVFIPFARPGGISHDDYTDQAARFFSTLGISVIGLHRQETPIDIIEETQGFFTGGGNTFLLVSRLHEMGLMSPLAAAVRQGASYLGTSAGSNIAGINMKTTNDMPIVYPPSFETMRLVPFNINPHYIDQAESAQHMGESRATRIAEFHTQNSQPVIGLREGSWIRVKGDDCRLGGSLSARIFEQGKSPYEIKTGGPISFG